MGSPPINIAIIGAGAWGMNYARVLAELPGARVAFVCDPDTRRLEVVRDRYHGVGTTTQWADVLAEARTDAVIVATPASTHFEIVRAALVAGRDVLVEKPITTNVADAEVLVRTAAEHKRVLMVEHTFLYNEGIRKMKELVRGPEFGKIYYLHATRTNMGPIRADVDVVWDLATHDVSIFNYLLDSVPESASAVASRVLGARRADIVFATLIYPSGIIAHIHTSWLDPKKVREVVAVGSRRRVVFDDLQNLDRVRVFEKGVSPSPPEADGFGEFRFLVRDGDIISPWIGASEPLRNVCTHFVECVATRRRPLSSGRDGLAVARVLAAIDESVARHGASVRVSSDASATDD